MEKTAAGEDGHAVHQLELNELIDLLGLRPLAGEGGLYAETYRSGTAIPAGALALPFHPGPHACGTAIYYLLSDACDSFSALHRLSGDEIYHFYLGDPVEMLLLEAGGGSQQVILGPDLRAGQHVQFVVPGGAWQGARLVPGGRYALLGTTMAPGFELSEFEVGRRAVLCQRYPVEREMIERLTRG